MQSDAVYVHLAGNVLSRKKSLINTKKKNVDLKETAYY